MTDENSRNAANTGNTISTLPTSEKLSTWLVRISTVPENGDPGFDDYEDFIELLVESRIISS